MTLSGDPQAWLDFIEDQVPHLLDLIIAAWSEMPANSADALEDPTTESLCRGLRRHRAAASLPFRIDTQLVELDPAEGEKQGRMDIVFSPMVPDEAYYFCLECKRLNVVQDGRRRSLAAEYVKDGVQRFVRLQYGRRVRHGGMLGYVLDGRIPEAIRNVRQHIENHRQALGLTVKDGLVRSRFAEHLDYVLESSHVRERDALPFLLQHIFVAAHGARLST